MKPGPFRFWGNRDPRERQKPAIRAELATADLGEGVARLRLYDPIDSYGGYWGVSAKEFADVLDGLPETTSEIRLHINSPGGEVFEGIAIMNLLRAHRARVVAVVDGLAASAASFLAASADELVMQPHTELMIHDAWGIAIGPAEDMRDMAERLDALSDNIASVYQRKAGGDLAEWRSAMLAETWYSAEESVEAGLADRVDEPEDVEDEAAKNAFDLSQFKHPGRAAAPAPQRPAEVPPPAAEPDGVDRAGRFSARRATRHERRTPAA